MPKYVSSRHLADITGFTTRWLSQKAARGDIPVAVKPGGSRGHWRFEEKLFWKWWNAGKPSPWVPTIEKKYRGPTPSVPGTGRSPLRKLLGMEDD